MDKAVQMQVVMCLLTRPTTSGRRRRRQRQQEQGRGRRLWLSTGRAGFTMEKEER
jgi:hypothetical protein